MKLFEVRMMTENSDGIWRGCGQPIFSGTKTELDIWQASNKFSFPEAIEIEVVTFKRGKEVKRKTL